jgi:hypothetical protein
VPIDPRHFPARPNLFYFSIRVIVESDSENSKRKF